jgi:hypothetical protein
MYDFSNFDYSTPIDYNPFEGGTAPSFGSYPFLSETDLGFDIGSAYSGNIGGYESPIGIGDLKTAGMNFFGSGGGSGAQSGPLGVVGQALGLGNRIAAGQRQGAQEAYAANQQASQMGFGQSLMAMNYAREQRDLERKSIMADRLSPQGRQLAFRGLAGNMAQRGASPVQVAMAGRYMGVA